MMFIGKKGEPTEIDIHLIRPNPDQPRKQFEQDELDELCDSIREFGIIQPLIVKKDKDSYILIAGERRLRAATNLGLNRVCLLYTSRESSVSSRQRYMAICRGCARFLVRLEDSMSATLMPKCPQTVFLISGASMARLEAVSYTHLDVYKRQSWNGSL